MNDCRLEKWFRDLKLSPLSSQELTPEDMKWGNFDYFDNKFWLWNSGLAIKIINFASQFLHVCYTSRPTNCKFMIARQWTHLSTFRNTNQRQATSIKINNKNMLVAGLHVNQESVETRWIPTTSLIIFGVLPSELASDVTNQYHSKKTHFMACSWSVHLARPTIIIFIAVVIDFWMTLLQMACSIHQTVMDITSLDARLSLIVQACVKARTYTQSLKAS